ASSLGKNAVVDSYGNITYTTAIEDGHAKLKAGGDATNSSDYEATKTNQNVYIGAPSTIKIASGGNLFQNWDANSVLTENRTNEDSFHKSYNTAINTLNTQINSLNAQNAKNDLAFQAAAQSAASYASDVQSLAKAMLQGGTFESWAKGQIQDKVNAAMATAIANATGMSPDMASQLVSWFEKKQADKKAKAKARTQEITSGLVTVASIAASFIAGPEMMAVGQAALQAVQGYQNGGMEGALVGAASGAATGYARQFGVNVSVSYSYSGGFGGSVGLGSSSLNAGVSFSQHGSSSFNIGGTYGNVSYNPQSGFSGSVNLTPGQNTGAMVNLGQHSGPSLTIQESDGSSGVGGSVTIDGKGNTTVAATYRNATVVSATGNVHNPSSFGNLSVNDNFNSDLNQNLAMGKADENLTAGRAELEAGRNAIAETGNEPQKEILNNENASAADQHGVLATLAKAGEFLTDPSSASTWLGRTTQDVVGSFLGSTGLGASDSNGFIDKNGKYVQRTCFTAGTLIRTKSGLKRIEKIEIGDYVLSINENNGKVSYQRVKQLFVNEVLSVNKLTYDNGYEVTTTSDHPFYLRGKGFTEVKNIRSGERSVTVASIRNSHLIQSHSNVSIGTSLASIGSESSRSNSASWSNEYNGTLGISKIEEVKEKTKVYNFEVENNHTYFVGKVGVLVHNLCMKDPARNGKFLSANPYSNSDPVEFNKLVKEKYNLTDPNEIANAAKKYRKGLIEGYNAGQSRTAVGALDILSGGVIEGQKTANALDSNAKNQSEHYQDGYNKGRARGYIIGGLSAASDYVPLLGMAKGGGKANGKSLYRYVSEGEANVIRNTGEIPNTKADGITQKPVYITDRKYNNAKNAKEYLQLPEKPVYRVEIDPNKVPNRSPISKINPNDNPQWGRGTGREGTSPDKIPVDPSALKKLRGANKP
ncbi:TIGR04388 family protein, partial [Leptospira broomii]|uniref:TIGR04388 family protein n=1 Tax=Leptospira broomii TaxID=301541 RepID=UPI0009FC6FE7